MQQIGHANTKIIQRKARHRKIETTLRYDHVSDDMVKDYFNKFQSEKKPKDADFKKENRVIGYI